MINPTQSLALLFLVAACSPVGKGPDPDVLDMSRPADLTATSLCSPKNCNGCCQGDVCQPGIKSSACGGAGAVCAVCAGAQTCGADLKCAYYPSSKWLVAAVQANITTTRSNGMPWRTDGSNPQPLVEYNAKDRLDPTAIVSSGNPPVWTVTWNLGFVYTAQELLSTGLDLQVLDQITGMPATAISNKHHVTMSQQDFTNRNLTYQGWEGVTTLTMFLQPQ